MSPDERRLQAELPEFLDLLGNVAGFVGGLDLSRRGEVPPEALSDLREGLLRALEFLHELFALRGEPPPSPEPGIAYGSLGPSLKRTLPQRLAAQLDDELNTVPGRRLEDLSQFAALGLHARITDLLRFASFLEEASGSRTPAPPTVVSTRRPARRPPGTPASEGRHAASAPPPEPPLAPAPQGDPVPPPAAAPPPVPTAGPDLSAYDIRIDEAGERIDATGASAWFAVAPGPRAVGEGLAAAFAVPFPGGLALAVAEGASSSLGARLAGVVAVRAFCRAVAANPAAPLEALKTAQSHLDMLLGALLSAGDASAALTRVRGSVTPSNARRILAHTREPEEALRRVAPALATGLVGAVALVERNGLRVSVVRLGPGAAEVRVTGRVVQLLGASRDASMAFLGPGERGSEEVARAESAAPLTLAPGDALLLGTPALGKGATGAWNGLATLWPSFPDGLTTGESAKEILRRAERWGEAEPSSFAGPLGFSLLLAR